MATYVSFFNFTEQGRATIKDTVKRTEAARKAAEQAGLRITEILWLQGPFDFVAITEADDEMAAVAFGFGTLRLGNVTGHTYRAYTAAEMARALEKLS